jgi:hypothetical protein
MFTSRGGRLREENKAAGDNQLWGKTRSAGAGGHEMAERRRFYRTLDLPVQTILTDNGREFCGIERQPYELYLALNDSRAQ